MLSDLKLGQPVVVALIAILICLLLFRPRNNQQTTRAAASAASTPKKLPTTSISTTGTLLQIEAGKVALIPDAVAALLRIARYVDVYLITTLPEDSDALEAAVMEALASAGIFVDGSCERCKALFCSTEDGRGAIVRQLGSALHIDCSAKVLQYLAPHLPRVVHVQSAGHGGGAQVGGAVVASSLAVYVEAHLRATATTAPAQA